jgi:lipopolysaccharide transport system ATP-binding protein
MSDTAIKFSNISKQYRLGLVSTKTLSHDLNRWWQTSILGKEDPYLKIGETNDRSKKGKSEYVWALRDIDFEVKKGDVLGIIGKNGAGKSTLLKILSRVTTPTTGIIEAEGRIASLLEVGTGFHPELTGRENIYMNGSIMGMTHREIDRKLDEIVDFAGVERYLDTPTKRYSSGMTVRLGFSIAAHLEPEILVVDEVLAVGDVEFQKKAIGKMQDVSKGEGRTVLFVSHNMASVQSLCTKGIIIKNGNIIYNNKIEAVIDKYLMESKMSIPKTKYIKLPEADKIVNIVSVEILNSGSIFYEDIIRIVLNVKAKSTISNLVVGIGINTMTAIRLVTVENLENIIPEIEANKTQKIIVTIPNPHIAPGIYSISVGMRNLTNNAAIQYLPDVLSFEIEENQATINISNYPQLGLRPKSTWTYEE